MKDILNTGNRVINQIIDFATRTYEGHWVMPEEFYDDNGNAWIYNLKKQGFDNVQQVLWEWYTDTELPVGYVLEAMCTTSGCVRPECLEPWLSEA